MNLFNKFNNYMNKPVGRKGGWITFILFFLILIITILTIVFFGEKGEKETLMDEMHRERMERFYMTDEEHIAVCQDILEKIKAERSYSNLDFVHFGSGTCIFAEKEILNEMFDR